MSRIFKKFVVGFFPANITRISSKANPNLSVIIRPISTEFPFSRFQDQLKIFLDSSKVWGFPSGCYIILVLRLGSSYMHFSRDSPRDFQALLSKNPADPVIMSVFCLEISLRIHKVLKISFQEFSPERVIRYCSRHHRDYFRFYFKKFLNFRLILILKILGEVFWKMCK